MFMSLQGSTVIDRIQAINSVSLETVRCRQKHSLSATTSYYEWKSAPTDSVETGPLNIYRFKDVSIVSSGRLQVHCHSSRLPIEESPINPVYVREIYRTCLNNGALCPSSMSSKVVQESCYLLAGWSPFEWGHLLVDFIPRIMLLSEYCNSVLDRPIYISSLTPVYIREVFRTILGGEANIKYYDDNCVTCFSDAISPQYAQYLDSGLLGYHPTAKMLVENAINHFLDDSVNCSKSESDRKKLFISRKHDSCYVPLNPARSILNEDKVIDIFRNHDFSIVRMEDFDCASKIHLLSQCSVIAGGFGSGLHNSILSTRKPRVISIGLGFNSAQVNICQLMKQAYYELPTYADPGLSCLVDDIRGTSQYADLDALQQSLDKILH